MFKTNFANKFRASVKIYFSIILFVLCCSFCKKSNIIKLVAANSEKWTSGIQGGGSGTEYYFKFKILSKENVEFDSLWIDKKGFKSYVENNKSTVSESPIVFTMNDTITLRVSESQKVSYYTSVSPIKYKGRALLRYKVKGNSHYLTIKEIKSIESLNRP